MDKILVICGPTATGKTSLGVKLAKKFSARGRPAFGGNGEIISADSRQVYKGMEIGTGKSLPVNSKLKTQNSKLKLKCQNYEIGYRLLKGVPVWLVDITEPNRKFSVAHWVRFAKLVIEDIWKRRHLPIIVGGTGFYIKGLLQGFETLGIRPDWRLRKQLDSLTARQLGSCLRKLDPQRWARMNESDRRNPRRLVRAIEIVKQAQGPKLKAKSLPAGRQGSKLKAKMFMIGLKTDYKTLYQRIDKRVDKRVKQGVVKEIQGLLKKGYSWDDPGFNTLGYKEFRDFFEKKISLEEAIQRWKYDEHKYARRQMTWFRKPIRQAFDPSSGRGAQDKPRTKQLVRGKLQQIHWFDINKEGWQNKLLKKVASFSSNAEN